MPGNHLQIPGTTMKLFCEIVSGPNWALVVLTLAGAALLIGSLRCAWSGFKRPHPLDQVEQYLEEYELEDLRAERQDFPETLDLQAWQSRLRRFGGKLLFVQDEHKLQILTSRYSYTITARPPTSRDPGYLGCGARRRQPRPDEDWLRGRDLADGPFSDETWGRIMTDIVALEIESE